MNSEAERQILGPLLVAHELKILFVDEPSPLRPKGPKFVPEAATQQLIALAEQIVAESPAPICLIGLSFGAILVEHLVAKFQDKIGQVVLISPTPDLASVFLKMMELAEQDFQLQRSPLEAQIREARLKVSTLYDSHCRAGLALTGQDPFFYGHYWKNKTAMASWAATLGLPEFGFDSLSQDKIYAEMAVRDPFLKAAACPVPMTLVLGIHDPVLDEARVEQIYQDKFKKVCTRRFENSGHFPHLEEPEKFLQLLTQLKS